MSNDVNRQKFIDDGFLIIENVVPEYLCQAVRQSICDFLNIREDEPDDWHKPGVGGHGIVPIHHPQALWDVRQLPAIHQVFSKLYDTEALWVSIDRVSFKPPCRDLPKDVNVDPIHWDINPRTRDKLSIQGLVYLADTKPEQGGFCCVPELYRNLDDWLAAHENDSSIRKPDVNNYQTLTVGAPAGSLLVWNRLLPHSSTRNQCESPRWVQYIAMDPVGDAPARKELVSLHREKRPPAWAIKQNVANQQIPEPGEPAQLTELGKRLAGIRSW